MDQPDKPGWWSRNWKWFVPVGCLTTILLIVAFVALMMSFVFGIMKSSDVYSQAFAQAKANQMVIEALGSPIKDGYFTSGSINETGPSGTAELSIPISGPKGSGTIYLEAHKSTGEWSFTKLLVEVDKSNERIDLLNAPDSSGSNPSDDSNHKEYPDTPSDSDEDIAEPSSI